MYERTSPYVLALKRLKLLRLRGIDIYFQSNTVEARLTAIHSLIENPR